MPCVDWINPKWLVKAAQSQHAEPLTKAAGWHPTCGRKSHHSQAAGEASFLPLGLPVRDRFWSAQDTPQAFSSDLKTAASDAQVHWRPVPAKIAFNGPSMASDHLSTASHTIYGSVGEKPHLKPERSAEQDTILWMSSLGILFSGGCIFMLIYILTMFQKRWTLVSCWFSQKWITWSSQPFSERLRHSVPLGHSDRCENWPSPTSRVVLKMWPRASSRRDAWRHIRRAEHRPRPSESSWRWRSAIRTVTSLQGPPRHLLAPWTQAPLDKCF